MIGTLKSVAEFVPAPAVTFQTFEQYDNTLQAAKRDAHNSGWRAGFWSGICAVVAIAFVVFVYWKVMS